MSIRLNGSPGKPFQLEKGLRQGCPLSPYILIMINEAFIYLMKEASKCNLTQSLMVGRDKIPISYLKFVDDTLVFLPKCEKHLLLIEE